MYLPDHFCESDKEKLHDFIERNSFALVTSPTGGSVVASHLPVLLEREAGAEGCLVGHMARANPHWQEAAGESLVVFSGPHAYISPTWYEAENVVPTWNYVAVHVYGTLHIVDETAAVIDILQRTVAFYEAGLPQPWTFDSSSEFIQRLAAMVVGFRIPIARMEGKWKLNQNHPQERRDKVVRTLAAFDDENSQAIAALIEQSRRRSEG